MNLKSKISSYLIYSVFGIACTSGNVAESQHQPKPNQIKIQAEQLILLDPNKYETPASMFDGDVQTTWFPGWTAESYPARLLIDLEGRYQLTGIEYYDGQGSYQITIKAGLEPDESKMALLADIQTDKFNTWENVSIKPFDARYIIVTIVTPKGKSPGEMIFYGKLLESMAQSAQASYIPKYPPFQDIMGVNAFPWVKDSLLKPFSSSREYLYWEWMEKQEGINEFSPSRNADFQEVYSNRRRNGIEPIPCVLNSPKWLLNAPDNKHKASYRPKLFNSDPQVPSSYAAFARFWYQFVARFGKNKVMPSTQTINTKPFWTNAKPNPLTSGEGLINYVEIWNEPNQWWNGPLAKFSPFEYAAMLSACYDGHESTIGKNYGAKNADSTVKVVFGGLAGLNVDYIKAVDLWAKMHRKDKKFPADVLNVHHYCNNKGEQKVPKAHAMPPEECNFLERLRSTASNLKKLYPEKEIWLSEYGYDTNKSTQSVESIGSLSKETVQAAWIMRSMLIISASGFDKAHLYAICDLPAPEEGLYMASGVLGESKKGYPKKEAWYYLLQLRQTLNDFTFYKEIIGNDQIWEFDFVNGKQKIKMVWSATASDRVVKNKKIAIGKATGHVVIRKFTNTDRFEDKMIIPNGQMIELDVNEIPQAIIYHSEDVD